VAKQLRSRGHQVVALVRSRDKAELLAKLGIELQLGDITEPATLRKPMEGADGVFHLAAWYKIGAPRAIAEATAINVGGTRHVLEAMREVGVPKGVYTSTLAVFSDTHGRLVDESYRYNGPHLTAYDETKWRAHYEVALPAITAGLPLVIVQPGAVYGPGDTSALRGIFVNHLRRRLPFAPARTAYCWGHVDDTAHAHIEAMERGRIGETYIIAGPPHTLIEFFEIAEELTGVPAPKIRVPPGMMRATAALSRLLENFVTLPELYSSESLRETAGVTYLGDNSKARRELGYNPRPLREGLAETLKARK
jgi:nucleoside-diphosphate-sugar epimerase